MQDQKSNDLYMISAVLLIVGCAEVIAIALAGATSQEAAAWIQALGAVGAIVAAWLTVAFQQRNAAAIQRANVEREERDRDLRRRTVIYRLAPIFYDITAQMERVRASLGQFDPIVSALRLNANMLEHFLDIMCINATWDNTIYSDLHLCAPDTARTAAHILYSVQNWNAEVTRIMSVATASAFALTPTLPKTGPARLDNIDKDIARIIPEIVSVLEDLKK